MDANSYTGRNRSRIKRDLAKGKAPKGMTPTEALMNAYGNKKKSSAEAIRTSIKKTSR